LQNTDTKSNPSKTDDGMCTDRMVTSQQEVFFPFSTLKSINKKEGWEYFESCGFLQRAHNLPRPV